jgi:hypothetical protein
LEIIMTRTFASLTLAAGLFAIPMLSVPAQADITAQLQNCRFNTYSKTVQCCNQIIKAAERVPIWWPTENRSCSTPGVVKCTTTTYGTAANQRRCYINVFLDDSNDGGNDTPTRQRQTRRGGQPRI